MKIAIAALGSRGDTQPSVALAEALIKRGHDVTVLASARYSALLQAAGVKHAVISFDPQEMVESPDGQAMLQAGPLGFIRGIKGVIEPLAEKLMVEMDVACAGMDLILAPTMGGCGRHIAERHGIAHVILQFQPSEPTGAFANPMMTRKNLGGVANKASFALIEGLTWTVMARMINRLRRSVLGLAPLRRSTFHLDRADRVLVLCGVSPAVVPRPADWPSYVHMTGFWYRSGRNRLPAPIAQFIARGPAPVFVGFGSMAPADPEAVAQTVRQALRKTGLRGVVQGLPEWPLRAGEEVFFVNDVDHAALFPKMAAVVHHGGAGTTATSMRAGVPSIICPFFGDQPFWGAKVAALGVGPQPLPIRELSADRLADRFVAATTNPQLQANAARVGRWLTSEEGVVNACRIIEAQYDRAVQSRFNPGPVVKRAS